MNKQVKMTEQDLSLFLQAEIENCIGYNDSNEIVTQRKEALKFYRNEPDGREQEGKAKVQDSTVHDVVEAALPPLLAPFISNDAMVEFTPRGENNNLDEAKEQTTLVNHVLMVDNNGTEILYQFAKDGLLQKNGFLYADWVEKKCTNIRMQKLNYAQLLELQKDENNAILKIAVQLPDNSFVEPKQELQPEILMQSNFEVQYRQSKTMGMVKINNIPPENMLVHEEAKYGETPKIIGWQEKTTISNLRAEGVSEEKIEELLKFCDEDSDYNGETQQRQNLQGNRNDKETSINPYDKSSTIVWRTIIFCHVDFDGDGYAEYRKIIRAGGIRNRQSIIIYNKEVDICPIVTWTPCIMPHEYFGRGLGDMAMPIQEITTSLLRVIMDNAYNLENKYAINSRENALAIEGMRNLHENDVVLFDDINNMRLLNEVKPNPAELINLMEIAERMREKRTGITRQMQAIDPDVLNDKTATEATIQSNASAQRQELQIRLFALGVKDLCVVIQKLLIKNQTEPRWLRITQSEEPISMNPAYWDSEMDVNVKVGLGTGTKQQQMQSLMTINELQLNDLQMQQGNVTPENRLNFYEQLVALTGLGNSSIYFGSGNKDDAQQKVIQDAQAKSFEEGRQAGAQEAAQQLQAEDKQRQAQKDQSEVALKQMDMQQRRQEHNDKMQLEFAKEDNKAKFEQSKIDIEALKFLKEGSNNDNGIREN
jgi:hypothetical protein